MCGRGRGANGADPADPGAQCGTRTAGRPVCSRHRYQRGRSKGVERAHWGCRPAGGQRMRAVRAGKTPGTRQPLLCSPTPPYKTTPEEFWSLWCTHVTIATRISIPAQLHARVTLPSTASPQHRHQESLPGSRMWPAAGLTGLGALFRACKGCKATAMPNKRTTWTICGQQN